MMKLLFLHVVALAVTLSQKGVHCQPPNVAKNPGCPAGQCNDTEICIDGQCLPRCISATSSNECERCLDSLYGKRCENKCPPTCLNASCYLTNKSRVTCTEGCEAGMKGRKCNVPCPQNCLNCDRYGDECDLCVSGNYGHICTTICPENCAGQCDIATGECTCKPGFRGRCSKCKPGLRGRRCTIRCPAHCRSDCELGECHCEDGYTGDECEDTCPPGCEDGCDRDTGRCHTCKPGYMGDTCSERCPQECSSCGLQDEFCTGCFTSDECDTLKKSAWGPPVTIAVGSTLLCLFLLLTIFVIVLSHKRRRKKKQRNLEMLRMNGMKHKRRNSSRPRECSMEWDTENPVYEPFINREISLPGIKLCPELKSKQSEHHMKKEFLLLPKPEVQSCHCGRLPENLPRNRYRDILPFDGSRVCLAVEDEGDCDYINASYIDGYKQNTQYIAAQGPTEEVLEDFWRMIWQCDVGNIVMLTNLVETDNEERCEMYWSQCDVDYKTYGNISVQCVEERVFEDHIVRCLAAWKSNRWTRLVKQFHYTAWPAQGVPAVDSLINFYKVVRDTGVEDTGATLVHCSAGVGRTGTFLALVNLVEQAKFEGRACVFSCVSDLRFQRMKLVYTEEQYIFLYHIVTAALQNNGILTGSTVPVWLQCKVCWETDKRHPVVNGVRIVYNPLDSDSRLTPLDRLL